MRTAAALIGALALSGGLAGGASASFPGRNGVITFAAALTDCPSAGCAAQRQDVTVNPDGTGVNTFRGLVRDPAWAPDGTRFAGGFLSYLVGASRISIVTDGTGGPRAADHAERRGRDRPDLGARRPPLAYSDAGSLETTGPGQPPRLFVMNDDGTDAHELNPALGAGVEHPSWSPNGRWIAFDRVSGSQSDIYVVRSDGTRLRRITWTRGSSETNPNWSPDSRRIAFDRAGTHGGVFTTGRRGWRERRVASASAYGPAWSPDGRWIALLRGPGDPTPNGSVSLVRPDGTGSHRILTLPSTLTLDDTRAAADWQRLRPR